MLGFLLIVANFFFILVLTFFLHQNFDQNFCPMINHTSSSFCTLHFKKPHKLLKLPIHHNVLQINMCSFQFMFQLHFLFLEVYYFLFAKSFVKFDHLLHFGEKGNLFQLIMPNFKYLCLGNFKVFCIHLPKETPQNNLCQFQYVG